MEKNVKETRKKMEEIGEKYGTYDGPLVQRTNYEKGNEIKKNVNKKDKRPFGEISKNWD